MRHASDKILLWIRRGLLIYSCHFLAAYVYQVFFLSTGIQGGGGYTFLILLVTAPHLIYELMASLFWIRKATYAITLVTLAMATLETFIVLQATGFYSSPYTLGVIALAFISASLGQYLPIGIIFLSLMSFLLGFDSARTANRGAFSFFGAIILAFTTISAGAGYTFWRKFYTLDGVDPEVNQLNSLLKKRQVQSEILLEAIADGVVVCDTEGKISIINPSAATMTGWSADEAAGIDVHAVMQLAQEGGAPLQNEEDLFSAVLAGQKHINRTLQLTNRNTNRAIIISLIVSPITAPEEAEVVGLIAVFRDISSSRSDEHRRAEFISTASHEMRTPVAAIEGYLALALNEKVSRIDARARDYLEKAHTSAQHLGKLFQDLLTSAKAEDGRLTSHPVILEVGEFLERLTDDLRFAAQKKNLAMEFIIGTSAADGVIDASNTQSKNKLVRPLYYVHADPDRLREVLTNLFDNAVKYTESGKVAIGLTGNKEIVQLYIRDTGMGIPAEDISHLFQKFYRIDNSATRVVGGTGLGLFISKKIIELYNGRIWVESEVNKGSTFYINLPRLDSQQAAEIKSKTSAQATTVSP